jgi:hypothetical protein
MNKKYPLSPSDSSPNKLGDRVGHERPRWLHPEQKSNSHNLVPLTSLEELSEGLRGPMPA